MILVTGATGNVGRHAVSLLVAEGAQVRALVRNPATAAFPEGVEVVKGDLTDPSSLPDALEGVDRVFLVWPGFAAETAAKVVDLVAEHARGIVYLSANLPEDSTMFHKDVERLIQASPLEWTFLRPGGFAANTLGWAEQIRGGTVRWVHGAAARSLIHEADIAAVAVRALLSDELVGQAPVLSGPSAVTQAEQVRIIGSAVGRDVRWEEMPPEEAVAQMAAVWGDPVLAREAVEAWGSFVTTPEEVTDAVERLTGRPARSFAEWAADHAADFR
ncbi:NAD(P)H-binding protein [Nonomuraea sp. NPDC049152]|uniref:NAD(P)H-binding protein n=1 Tax=Nonomuraea sp. NPDC049152 TaxID=3154350 RepID=UPI0033C3CF98